jgi:hypothetical protein
MAEAQPWYVSEFGSEFWLVISGSLFAFLGLGLRACLKSRCTNIKVCWGLYECQRIPEVDGFDSPIGLQLNEGIP